MLDSAELLKQVMRLLNQPARAPAPAQGAALRASVGEAGEDVVVVLELPGIQRREDVSFSVSLTRLAVKGVRQRVGNPGQGGGPEPFENSINLPVPVRPETATALYSRGIVEIRIKKLPDRIWDKVFVQFI